VPDERRIRGVGGVGLAVRVWPDGAGAPFVLVHGLASSARLWDGVAAELQALGHPVAALDQRGHGQSDKPTRGYDFATVTSDLVAVIDGIGFDRPVLAGQSWGGNVVLDLAWRRPDLMRGIVCVDGGTIELKRRFRRWGTVAHAMAPPTLTGTTRRELEDRITALHPDWPDAGIAGVMACFEDLPDGTVRARLSRDNHLEILRHLWKHRPSRLYADIKVPVLLLPADDGHTDWGPDKRAGVDAAAAAIPHARVHWFTADHDVHAQHPDQVAAVMHAATEDGFLA
jgi:pimeloyl-ACP methyl ester carboxylesterase